MPAVQTLYANELKPAGIDVISISQFRTSEPETVAFVERAGLSFGVIYDEEALVASVYGVNGVPSYAFLDHQGNINHIQSGARGVAVIRERLNRLLAESQ